jgi:purine-binding chemotaxis protein CheW
MNEQKPRWVGLDKQKVLHERAVALAREPAQAQPDEATLELVEFQLAAEHYGIESVFVREVYPLKQLTPVPCTPPFVMGIINVRGQIVTVVDLKRFFDLPQQGLGDLNKVLILHAPGMALGLLADAIIGLRQVPAAGLQPTLATLTDARANYLRGITADRLVVLDTARILADPKIIVHEEVEN